MSLRLAIDGLSVALPKSADRPLALDSVSLTLSSNEILCLVGESGSGKSTAGRAVMRLLPPSVQIAAGKILLDGQNLPDLPEADMRAVRGARIGMIFQEPMTALNPLRTIGDQVGEVFRVHTTLSRAEIAARVQTLLTEVLIPDPVAAAKAYPHELSGGQRQRAMIAMALALEPAVLIADEPTTALDVTTQAQILKLIRDLQRRHGTAVLFITHDFGVVAEIADRVAVMQAGRIVEQGPAEEVLNRPQHPYTRSLIAAVPPLAPAERPRPQGAGAADGAGPDQNLWPQRLFRHRPRYPRREGGLAGAAPGGDAGHRRRKRIGQINAGPLSGPADPRRWRQPAP